MAKKTKKIKLTQENGIITGYRNEELEFRFDVKNYIKLINEGTVATEAFANRIAELIHDSLNCKTAVATLKDLNDRKEYVGTYFENLDYLED